MRLSGHDRPADATPAPPPRPAKHAHTFAAWAKDVAGGVLDGSVADQDQDPLADGGTRDDLPINYSEVLQMLNPPKQQHGGAADKAAAAQQQQQVPPSGGDRTGARSPASAALRYTADDGGDDIARRQADNGRSGFGELQRGTVSVTPAALRPRYSQAEATTIVASDEAPPSADAEEDDDDKDAPDAAAPAEAPAAYESQLGTGAYGSDPGLAKLLGGLHTQATAGQVRLVWLGSGRSRRNTAAWGRAGGCAQRGRGTDIGRHPSTCLRRKERVGWADRPHA